MISATSRTHNLRVSRQAAASELLARRRARASLIDFTTYTKPDFLVGEHHKQIAEALESVERGECDRLMIFAPPRHTKSELASRRFPAWYLGRHPDKQLIAATYSGDFALDFGRDVRGIVQGEEFKALFPDVSLAADSQAANRWHTNHGGVSVYVGVGGPITGRGAHCFVAGTKVLTDQGMRNIEELESCAASIKILSYGQGGIEAKALQAFSIREGAGIYRITTAAGRVVEATGDHPFYVAGRYVEASQLAAGDPVLCAVPQGLSEASVRGEQAPEARPSGHVLFAGLFVCRSRDKESTPVHPVREGGRKEDAEVLRELPWYAGSRSSEMAANPQGLPYVQCAISVASSWQRAVCRVLQQTMRRAWALTAHVWRRESKVQGWGDPGQRAAALSQGVQSDAPAGVGAGWSGLRGVCGVEDSARSASPRQLAHEQRGIESGDAVREVPQRMAQGQGWEVEHDAVALVERVRETATVYDIQVEGNHNFFANGVLVHNCALIDDPFKNREEADSEVRRETVWKWYTSTLRTRLMPGGAIVLILTRWHEDDLAGRLLERQGDEWKVIELPAIKDEGQPHERALWPEWYDLGALKRIRADIGPRDWSALYQQKPTPDEGTYFQRDWFRWYDTAPKHLNCYICSDYAVSEGGGDWTEHGAFGIDPDDNLYILDWWSGQTAADVWIETLLDMVGSHKPFAAFGESGVIRKAVEPYLTRRARERKEFCRFEWITRTGDKAAMARGFQARASMGKVYLPKGKPWAEDLLRQLLTFPAGKHDDKVDVCALMGMALDQAHPAIVQRDEAKKPLDRWDKAFGEHDDVDDWKTV